jgi:peptide chain release factor 2
MRRLSEIQESVTLWRKLEDDARSLEELCQISVSERDMSLQNELAVHVAALTDQLDKLEFQLAFQGEYDSRNAILAIHSGTGGTDSQDWAEMLLRMYLRWAERRGFEALILDVSQGEEAGIKSAQLEIRGQLAYGYLKSEKGVHRLVRLSPFDSDHARHTSFALVEVLPEAEKDIDIEIDHDDLRFDYFRASGAGGQNVQKNSTAVRVVHEPTGITVAVQNERSQRQNREAALKILMTRLMQVELAKRAEEKEKLKGEYVAAQWGNRIRSYVLHPYKIVKDHRTGVEASDPDAVLDGDLDEFMTAYLRQTVGQPA